ncbi:hypothetical protein C900_02279 [Fulvivirga imtechensis AK7]|uniref:Uncharacterized protein n=1 Tax=Fulvivirga imtechensis AK7 TaxID=1237149 RepID=L8JVQ1_9BACT|nr:hypothetical protein C900_02279 [Fulvivirga imtechensis AK7]
MQITRTNQNKDHNHYNRNGCFYKGSTIEGLEESKHNLILKNKFLKN